MSLFIKKWAFTLSIVAAVVLGLTIPKLFIGVGDFKFTSLFVPILQLIMFCMGTTLSIGDFARVIRMPAGVGVGLVCQFTIMPLIGFGLVSVFGLPPEIAAGVVLVGASPSGLASNVMALIAKADVAMSVTMTAVATMVSPLVTPFLMKLLAGSLIEVDALAMMWSMTKMVVLPVLAGLVFHHLIYHRAKCLQRIMPLISIMGIVVMTVLTVAIGRDNLITMGAILILVCFLHITAGYSLGYFICRMLRLEEKTCRTIALEVGMQNSGMASGIAASMGKVATLGLAPIVFGPIMTTTASAIANWWRTHPTKEELLDES
jgi:BASS family bile acid:Na+ symporter